VRRAIPAPEAADRSVRDAGREPAFDRVAAAFSEALRARPDDVHESRYVFGGRGVRLRVVGRALAMQIRRPFVHLQEAARPADRVELQIDLWDERETNVAHPSDSSQADLHAVESGATGWDGAGASDGEESQRWRVGGGLATSFERGRVFRYVKPGAITWLDRGAGRAIGWRASGLHLAPQEQSKPLPLLLGIWYYDCDVHMVHAGLVARRRQGVLVGGGSGAGKSTTTLACLQTGFEFLGDDQCGLQALEDGSFLGHSVYGGARVEPHHVGHFPQLRAGAGVGQAVHDDKLLLFPAEMQPTHMARTAIIRVIVLPRVVAAEQSRVRRASKGEALLRLAPTSLFTAFGAGAGGFERLGRLVERVPCFWLELGRDISAVPERVEALLDESAARR
jgi:hypothetical protein